MPEEITRNLFDKLVLLASLELDEQESEYLRGQLNAQLRAVRELGSIPIPEGVPPARHGVPFPPEVCPGLRGDAVDPFPGAEKILGQGPQVSDGQFIVPGVAHTRVA